MEAIRLLTAANLVSVATVDVIAVGSFVDDVAVDEIIDETNSIVVACLFLGACGVSILGATGLAFCLGRSATPSSVECLKEDDIEIV